MSPINEGMLRRSATRKPADRTFGRHACTHNRHLTIWAMCAAATMLLIWTAPAQANVCNQWDFPGGRYLFNQSNGYTLELSSPSGQEIQTRALAWNGSGDKLYGRAGGTVNGYNIGFDVQWTNGHIGAYQGKMNLGGFASGTTYDLKDPSSTASWESVAALRCIS
jgi:hypothetical protein